MKEIFDYINTNTFLATIIGVVAGWILNFVSNLYFHNKETKEKRNELNRQERSKQFENKPELCVCKEAEQQNVDVEIFLAPFQVVYNEKGNYKNYEIVYSKSLKNKKT